MKLLITGSNGFVGRALTTRLERDGHTLVKATRDVIGDIDGATDWTALLADCEAVVHLAARVHIMNDTAEDPLRECRKTNTEASVNLARQAAQAGVKRFVFISTAKVHGEGRDAPYGESDTPVPFDAYATSKWEAEQQLAKVAADTGMELVILRPPLVYGPQVGANFLKLMGLVARSVPLPLGAIHNRRSMVFISNLVDAICQSISHPKAAGHTFLVSDGQDVSSAQLVQLLANALGKRAWLIPVPVVILKLAGTLLGKQAQIERLTGSFAVSNALLCQTLGWKPPFSLKEGLHQTAHWYQQQ